jgi:hypothetical protein
MQSSGSVPSTRQKYDFLFTIRDDVFCGLLGMARKSPAGQNTQPSVNESQSSEFQIDLQGLIKLLAKNLYAERMSENSKATLVA